MRDERTSLGYYVSAIVISSLLLPFIFISMWMFSICGCVEFNGHFIERSAFAVLNASLISIVLGGIALLLCAKGLSIHMMMNEDDPPEPAKRRMDRGFVAAFMVSLTIYLIVWLIFISVSHYIITEPPFC